MSESLLSTIIVGALVLLIAAGGYAGYRYKSNADRADTAEANVTLQGTVIQALQDQDKAFNGIGDVTAAKNTRASAKSEETVIEYRTILHREKTCDLPVPADVSDGLLRYTNRLRSSAMQTSASGTDSAGTGTIAAGGLTYCQAVLWIHPLLTAIEKANNQLSAIRQAEQLRQGTTQ
ncbi:hypothetical protein [Klebsiella michiganensis]|uniref:hypothetical protein n=1 Tax=Klebsiella michiganensis TaxID=1134687 RepID=UPI0012B6E3FC|nr:hypothetical protein [Klebsiella michiganensis]